MSLEYLWGSLTKGSPVRRNYNDRCNIKGATGSQIHRMKVLGSPEVAFKKTDEVWYAKKITFRNWNVMGLRCITSIEVVIELKTPFISHNNMHTLRCGKSVFWKEHFFSQTHGSSLFKRLKCCGWFIESLSHRVLLTAYGHEHIAHRNNTTACVIFCQNPRLLITKYKEIHNFTSESFFWLRHMDANKKMATPWFDKIFQQIRSTSYIKTKLHHLIKPVLYIVLCLCQLYFKLPPPPIVCLNNPSFTPASP